MKESDAVDLYYFPTSDAELDHKTCDSDALVPRDVRVGAMLEIVELGGCDLHIRSAAKLVGQIAVLQAGASKRGQWWSVFVRLPVGVLTDAEICTFNELRFNVVGHDPNVNPPSF